MPPRVLIVDDNEDNREVLADALADEGYALEQAGDGHEALELVARHRPDVVLLDVMMPRIDGIECCRRLKSAEATAHIPVILVTALDHHEHVIRGLDAGATDYVTKPFAGPVVRARVRAVLRSKLAHDTLSEKNRQIRQLVAAMAQKNKKLATLTDTAHRFVDNVAHEFRTPLTVIKEFSAIIADGLGGPTTERQREYLQFIEFATRDLAQMVDDFLDSSKLKAQTLRIDRRPCRVESIFESVRPMLLVRARQKGITVREAIAPGTPAVFADAEKAARVILNLAVNAIKFSPAGSEILLGAAPAGSAPDEDVRIEVTDHGPGLDAEDVERVFDRFKQVGDVERASTKGFGLGLNIAKELVWLNLGSVRLRSERGAGSTFSFTLPTCARDLIIDRYLDRLRELDEAPVQLAVLRARPGGASADVEGLRRFLVSACHPMDLVLADEPGASVIIVGATLETQQWIERVLGMHRANARGQGAEGPTPEPDLSVLGTWSFAAAEEAARFVSSQFASSQFASSQFAEACTNA